MESTFWTIVILVLYFVPAVIAYSRGHKNSVPILLTCFIFGWTGIGWLVALIWAYTSNVIERKQ